MASDERSSLALDKLYPILRNTPNRLDIWLSSNYDEILWKPRLDEWQTKIDKLRAWATTLGWLDRRAYSSWLDFYQYKLDSA